jgi:hypothetical protein
MSKKSKKKSKKITGNNTDNLSYEFSDTVEEKFKLILKVMSWVVGVCFVLIIILPNFDFSLVDILVKFIFFLGVFNLFMFAFLEMFAVNIKKFLSKYTQ